MLTRKGKRILKNGTLKLITGVNFMSMLIIICGIDSINTWQPYLVLFLNFLWLWLFSYANGWVTDTKPYFERMEREYGIVYEDYEEQDGMAYKTMLRQLISKWGIMSIDMMTAMDGDMAVINEDGTKDYVDNGEDDVIGAPVREEPEQEAPQKEQQTRQQAPAQDPAAALFN